MMRSVAASAVADAAMPPPQKQSSQSQISSEAGRLGAARVLDQFLRRELRADDDAQVHGYG